MAKKPIICPTFRRPDEQRSGPEADHQELGRRGLLADHDDPESLSNAGGFVREVEIPARPRRRSHGRPTRPT